MRVFIIAALSADGFIAQRHDQLVDWSSAEDKRLFVSLTKEAGVTVMGSNTFNTIGHALSGRKMIVYTSQPHKYQQLENVEPTQETPQALITRLETEGYPAVAICGGAQTYDQFLHADVVDEIYMVVEPVLFGQGIPLLMGPITKPLRLLDLKKLNENTYMAHYSITKNGQAD